MGRGLQQLRAVCSMLVNQLSSVMTLKMASPQVVETSVTNNSPSQDSYHPDDLFQSRYVTPGFKPFSYLSLYFKHSYKISGPNRSAKVMH